MKELWNTAQDAKRSCSPKIVPRISLILVLIFNFRNKLIDDTLLNGYTVGNVFEMDFII